MAENVSPISSHLHARAIECLAIACAFTLYATAVFILHLSIAPQIVFTVVFLGSTLLLAWRNFNGGMHPVFLFVSLLCLFQGGGLLAFLVSSGKVDPMKIYTAEVPFDMPDWVQSETLLLLVFSALLLYALARLFDGPVHFEPPANPQLLPFITAILLISLPFHFWKNYEYLIYVRTHGGYLAIFRSDEHITEVGFFVRAMSQLCSSAFIVYFVYARRGWKMLLLCSAYFGISIVELMIGLRGRVMLLFICFLFLWKLKQNRGFRLRGLVVLIVAFVALSQLIATFRENKAQSVEASEVPQIFLSSQGVSLSVTEAAIAYRPQFSPYAWSYLRHGIAAIFGAEPMPQAMYPQGQVLDVDTTMFLNHTGLALGFGTGGSYLAEGYVFGGALGVLLETLLIGIALIVIAHNLTGWRTAFSWTIMLSFLYLPRANLTTSLSTIAHGCAGIFAVFVLSTVMQKASEFLRFASRGAEPSTPAA